QHNRSAPRPGANRSRPVSARRAAMKICRRKNLWWALMLLPFLASRPNAAPTYSSWSDPVNIGPTINTTYNETAPTVSKDGLSLYFSSNRPCGEGDAVLDLNVWVARRASSAAPWNSPECLEINVDGFEDSAAAF